MIENIRAGSAGTIDPAKIGEEDWNRGCAVLVSAVTKLFHTEGIREEYEEWLKRYRDEHSA